MKTFEVGDVVELNSYGPRMTVTRKCAGQYYFCMWFDIENNIRGEQFPGNCLKACHTI